MLGTSWVNLFRRIPANLHDSLQLTLVNSMEIVVQTILKLEPDFVVLRGRMAGTQDQGRVAIVPYTQLLSVAFTKKMTDPEVVALFGASATAFAAPLAVAAADVPLAEPTAEEDMADDTPVAGGHTPGRPEMPSKSILLAKLRARLTESQNGK